MPNFAPFVDRAFAALDGPAQPLDCALIVEFAPGQAPSSAALESGAARALRRFPKSACVLRAPGWVAAPKPALRLHQHRCADRLEADAWVASFLDRRFVLGAELALEQALVQTPDRAWLVLRMHHALGDLISAVNWLATQLGAATEAPVEPALELQTSSTQVRRSRYAFAGPAARIAVAPQRVGPSRRAWRTLTFAKLSTPTEDKRFTYSDVLAAIALETLSRWNEERGGGLDVGLWLPVNVRARPFEGFGNGSGRIRVYRHPRSFGSFGEAAAQLREQVRWSRANGEWCIPRSANLLASVGWVASALAKRLAGRPGVDMGTAMFSHAERLAADPEAELFPRAQGLEIVAQLYSAHPLAMNASSHRGRTSMTFTWDASLFSQSDSEAFIGLFDQQRERAFAELARG